MGYDIDVDCVGINRLLPPPRRVTAFGRYLPHPVHPLENPRQNVALSLSGSADESGLSEPFRRVVIAAARHPSPGSPPRWARTNAPSGWRCIT